MHYQQPGAQEPVRKHGQDGWPALAKVVFHNLEHHVHYINWGQLGGKEQPLPGDHLDISQQAVRNFIVHHFFFLGIIPLSFSFPVILVYFILFYFNYETVLVSTQKVYLSCPILLPTGARGNSE